MLRPQAALSDGTLAYSAVANIPHSERYGMNPYVRLHTTRAKVSFTGLRIEWWLPSWERCDQADVSEPITQSSLQLNGSFLLMVCVNS